MLTAMTEDDWAIVLGVFDAAQSRAEANRPGEPLYKVNRAGFVGG